MSGYQRDIRLAVKKYVGEFAADVARRSGNCDLHGFFSLAINDVQALSLASEKGSCLPVSDHVFAYSFFERPRRRAAMFRKLKRGNPDVGVDDDDHPLDRTLRRGFPARTSLMSRGTSASV